MPSVFAYTGNTATYHQYNFGVHAGVFLAGWHAHRHHLATAAVSLLSFCCRETLSGTANGVVRFARAGYNGLSAVYDYKFVVGPAEDKHGKGSDEHK